MSLQSIAKICGISASTVSRVLSGKGGVRPKTVERVLQACEATGYKRNMLAHATRCGRSFTAVIIVPDVSSSFYASIVRGFSEVFEQNN